MNDDILDSVLDLEETSYQAGFEEGKADGLEAGYTEGRVFGIERGYHKALEMGKLHGRALMLNACLFDPNPMPDSGLDPSPFESAVVTTQDSRPGNDNHALDPSSLPTLPENSRLKKHVETLLKLTDPQTLSEENTAEAVEAFDDRMKKAVAKAKIIDRMIAEPYNMSVLGEPIKNESQPTAGSGNIEELNNAAVRH